MPSKTGCSTWGLIWRRPCPAPPALPTSAASASRDAQTAGRSLPGGSAAAVGVHIAHRDIPRRVAPCCPNRRPSGRTAARQARHTGPGNRELLESSIGSPIAAFLPARGELPCGTARRRPGRNPRCTPWARSRFEFSYICNQTVSRLSLSRSFRKKSRISPSFMSAQNLVE